jgi:histone acetyltransferase (RNA polymerase elongator complex component)
MKQVQMNKHKNPKRTSPFIIPIFLPQWGCPFQCVYCRQESITGLKRGSLDFSALSALVEAGLASRKRRPGQETEIAFYGGTFTSIEASFQEALLEWGSLYVQQGRVNGLQISTRPEALSQGIVSRLWDRGVKTIELGVQSLDDLVLKATWRGYTA